MEDGKQHSGHIGSELRCARRIQFDFKIQARWQGYMLDLRPVEALHWEPLRSRERILFVCRFHKSEIPCARLEVNLTVRSS